MSSSRIPGRIGQAPYSLSNRIWSHKDLSLASREHSEMIISLQDVEAIEEKGQRGRFERRRLRPPGYSKQTPERA